MFALDPCPDLVRNFTKAPSKEQEVWFTLLIHTVVFLQPTQKITGRVSLKTNIYYSKCVWGFLPFASEILKRTPSFFFFFKLNPEDILELDPQRKLRKRDLGQWTRLYLQPFTKHKTRPTRKWAAKEKFQVQPNRKREGRSLLHPNGVHPSPIP